MLLAALIGSCRSGPSLVRRRPAGAQLARYPTPVLVDLTAVSTVYPTVWEAVAATAEPDAYAAMMHRLVADATIPVAERQRRWQACRKARQTYWRSKY